MKIVLLIALLCVGSCFAKPRGKGYRGKSSKMFYRWMDTLHHYFDDHHDVDDANYIYGKCEMHYDDKHDTGSPSKPEGNILLKQNPHGGYMEMKIDLTGFDVEDEPHKHGYAVHEYGADSIVGGCSHIGKHYDPGHHHHGHPDSEDRHEGDLGNLVIIKGSVHDQHEDKKASLIGAHSIFGRSIAVHSGEDDYDTTTEDGHEGGTIACCTITTADGHLWYTDETADEQTVPKVEEEAAGAGY